MAKASRGAVFESSWCCVDLPRNVFRIVQENVGHLFAQATQHFFSRHLQIRATSHEVYTAYYYESIPRVCLRIYHVTANEFISQECQRAWNPLPSPPLSWIAKGRSRSELCTTICEFIPAPAPAPALGLGPGSSFLGFNRRPAPAPCYRPARILPWKWSRGARQFAEDKGTGPQ